MMVNVIYVKSRETHKHAHMQAQTFSLWHSRKMLLRFTIQLSIHHSYVSQIILQMGLLPLDCIIHLIILKQHSIDITAFYSSRNMEQI